MPKPQSSKSSEPTRPNQPPSVLVQYHQRLQEFEKRFGLEVKSVQQQSDRWLQMKLGVVSMSNASRAVAKKGSETRNTYLCELVAEVCTGVIEELSFKQMEWGKQHEDAARSSYEFSTGQKMIPMTFFFKDSTFRIGCSPDGVVLVANKPSEIKCPWDSTNYIKFLVNGIVKPEWVWQTQGIMWVMDAEEMDVTQFDPRMKAKPIHTMTVKKDPEYQKKLDDAIPELILDMDNMLREVGVEFGEQWVRLAEKRAEGVA